MLHAGIERGAGHVLAFLDFSCRAYGEVVLDAVHAVDTSHRFFQARQVIHIPLRDLDPLIGKGLRAGAMRILDKGPHRQPLLQQMANHGASLPSRRACHQDWPVAHIGHLAPLSCSRAVLSRAGYSWPGGAFPPSLIIKVRIG